MANTTYKQIRQGIENSILQITTANGYTTNLVDANIKKISDHQAHNSQDLSEFPKIFVLLDAARIRKLASQRWERTVNFIVVAAFRYDPASPIIRVTDKIEWFIEDMDRRFAEDDTLNGLAQDIKLTEFTTDSGVTDPEAVALFRLEVLYFVER